MKIPCGARLFTALAAVLLLASCSAAADDSRVTDGRTSHWDKGAGVPEVSSFMKVTVPEDATEAKGAVQVNPQEDVYVLSFVTGAKKAEEIAEDLRSEKPPRAKKHDLAPKTELFGHLGLAEPQTLKGARWAGVCPPCVHDDRRKQVQWIEIYIQPLAADRARIYLQAF